MLEPRFAAVQEALAEIIGQGNDRGAGVCVYHRGRPVVDIVAGTADVKRRTPWETGTVAPLVGATKGITATVVLRLIDQGLLELDAPIAQYWPEFGAAGKSDITLRHVLSHQAGIPALDKPVPVKDLISGTDLAGRLAALRPEWEPGSAHGYHAITAAWVLEELVRQVTGKSIGDNLAEHIAGPLGLRLFLGSASAHADRMAAMVVPMMELMRGKPQGPDFADFSKQLGKPRSLLNRSLNAIGMTKVDQFNDRAFLGAGEPAMSAVGSAPGLARMYAALIGDVDGIRLVGPESMNAARKPESAGHDRVLQLGTAFGLGYMLPGGPMWSQALSTTQFGHGGNSGAVGFADPDNELAMAYVPNRMSGYIEGIDDNARVLIDAVYHSLT